MLNRIQTLIYQPESIDIELEIRIADETAWIPQKAITELYQSTKQNISLHIKNIFDEKELDEDSVVKYCLTTARDGKIIKQSTTT